MNIDKIFFISHVWLVRIFLLFLIVKWVMLLIGKKEALSNLRSKTKIVDMILGTLVLVTGLTLAFRMPGGAPIYVWIKLVGLLAAIPLGIVGFRKESALLATLSVLLIAGAMGLAYAKPAFISASEKAGIEVSDENQVTGEDPVVLGKQVYYKRTCNTCHGDDGKAGYMGAKPLTETTLSEDEMKAMILNGKEIMPANPDISETDLNNLIAFVKSLK